MEKKKKMENKTKVRSLLCHVFFLPNPKEEEEEKEAAMAHTSPQYSLSTVAPGRTESDNEHHVV